MPTFQLSSEPDASDADQQFVRDSLDEFNMVLTQDRNYWPLNIFVRDDSDAIVGGLLGDIWGGWLHINYVWMSDVLRGQGYGTQLMDAAEREARAHACRGMILETFTFQAPEFYARFGFVVAGQVNDYPTGHSHIIMQKRLD